MGCANKLMTQAIKSNCTNSPVGGWKQKGWFANRGDIINPTQTENVVSAFGIAVGSQLFTIE